MQSFCIKITLYFSNINVIVWPTHAPTRTTSLAVRGEKNDTLIRRKEKKHKQRNQGEFSTETPTQSNSSCSVLINHSNYDINPANTNMRPLM